MKLLSKNVHIRVINSYYLITTKWPYGDEWLESTPKRQKIKRGGSACSDQRDQPLRQKKMKRRAIPQKMVECKCPKFIWINANGCQRKCIQKLLHKAENCLKDFFRHFTTCEDRIEQFLAIMYKPF